MGANNEQDHFNRGGQPDYRDLRRGHRRGGLGSGCLRWIQPEPGGARGGRRGFGHCRCRLLGYGDANQRRDAGLDHRGRKYGLSKTRRRLRPKRTERRGIQYGRRAVPFRRIRNRVQRRIHADGGRAVINIVAGSFAVSDSQASRIRATDRLPFGQFRARPGRAAGNRDTAAHTYARGGEDTPAHQPSGAVEYPFPHTRTREGGETGSSGEDGDARTGRDPSASGDSRATQER